MSCPRKDFGFPKARGETHFPRIIAEFFIRFSGYTENGNLETGKLFAEGFLQAGAGLLEDCRKL